MNLSEAQMSFLYAIRKTRGWAHSWDEKGNTLSCSGLGVLGLEPWGVHREVLAMDDFSRMYIWNEAGHSPWEPVLHAGDLIGQTRAHASTPDMVGPQRPKPGTANLCQGWRKLRMPVDGKDDRGHTFFWLAHESNPWKGWMVSSTTKRATDGTNGTQVEGSEPVSLAQAIDSMGIPTDHWPDPMEWPTSRYKKGIAFLELP